MVVRQGKHLQDLINKIDLFRNGSSGLDIETENLLVTAEILARSAIYRKESRGVHYREDFPETDPAFEKPSVLYKDENGEMVCSLGQ
jgi:aspartate oxidase